MACTCSYMARQRAPGLRIRQRWSSPFIAMQPWASHFLARTPRLQTGTADGPQPLTQNSGELQNSQLVRFYKGTMGLMVFAQSQGSLRKHSVIKHINIFAAKQMNIQNRQDKYSLTSVHIRFCHSMSLWQTCKEPISSILRTSQSQIWNDGPVSSWGRIEIRKHKVIKDALQRSKCYNR